MIGECRWQGTNRGCPSRYGLVRFTRHGCAPSHSIFGAKRDAQIFQISTNEPLKVGIVAHEQALGERRADRKWCPRQTSRMATVAAFPTGPRTDVGMAMRNLNQAPAAAGDGRAGRTKLYRYPR